jgi:hypothetical protein
VPGLEKVKVNFIESPPSCFIYFEGFDVLTTSRDQVLERFSSVNPLRVFFKRTLPYGYVEFESAAKASVVYKGLSNQEALGGVLRLDFVLLGCVEGDKKFSLR